MKDSKKHSTNGAKLQMIEFLKGDPIAKKVNKTGKKITVKHYLKFDSVDKDSGRQMYQIYVKIIFDRKNTDIVSSIYSPIILERFQNAAENNSTDYKKAFIREALHITDLISQYYCDVISTENNAERSKPFISEALSHIPFRYYSITSLVNLHLKHLLFSATKNDNPNSSLVLRGYNSIETNSFQLLEYLVTKDPVWNGFKNNLGNTFCFFQIYYLEFASTFGNSHYITYPATVTDFYYFGFEADFKQFMATFTGNNDVDLSFLSLAISKYHGE